MVRVTVLGSGDAFNAGGRANSAYLFDTSSTAFLVDCGPTTLQALRRSGYAPGRIDAVVISHLHGDHFGGLAFLLLDYIYETQRTRPLVVHGPPDTKRRVQALFAALYERIASSPLPFPLEFRELQEGQAFAVGDAQLLPVRVPHAAELTCFAFRITVAGRTVFYSGDTGWTEELVRHARGADLFLCECSRYDTPLEIHLAYPEIAARVRDFGCRRIVLTHLGNEPLNHRSDLTLECAEDGMTIEL